MLFRSILRICACALLLGFTVPSTAGQSIGLIEAYISALANNPDRKTRMAALEGRRHDETAARGALWPQLSLGANYSHIDENISGEYYAISDVDSSDNFVRGLIGLQLSQSLYEPDRWAALSLARLSTERAELQLRQFDNNLLVFVAEAYFGVLRQQDALALREAEIDHLQTQVRQLSQRMAAGLELEAAVLTARSRLATAKAQAIEERYALQADFARLDALTGEEFRDFRALPTGMVIAPPEPNDSDVWADHARQTSLQVQQAELATHIAEREHERRKSARLPTVSLSGSAGYLDISGSLAGERTERETRIGVDFRLPLFSGGTTSARIAAAQADVTAADAALDAARAHAARQTRIDFARSAGAHARVPAFKLARAAAREAERAALSARDAGTRTAADVLAAVQARFDAERAFSAARYDYMLSSLRLHASAGLISHDNLRRFDRLLRPSAR